MTVHDHFAKENPNSSCLKHLLSFLLRGNSDAQGVTPTKPYFQVNSWRKKSIVLTPNIAALSRG